MSFVHLHCHSHYSFLDGTMSPADLVAAAKGAGHTAVAMVDAANMCGMVEFQKAAKKEDIKPIFGVELWTIPDNWEPKSDEDNKIPAPGYHLVFLVCNDAGYRNLCWLITKAHHQRHFTPRIQLAQLEGHTEGLVVLTSGACGPMELITDTDALDTELNRLTGMLEPDSLFIELMDWGLEGDSARNERAIVVADRLGLPTIATNQCMYSKPEHSPLLDIVHCISTATPGTDSSRPGQHETDQAYYKSTEEMADLFDPGPLQRAAELAERCTYTLQTGEVFLPVSDPPKRLKSKAEKWVWLLDWFPPPTVFGDVPKTPPTGRLRKGWTLVDTYLAWYARKGLEVRLAESDSHFQFATRAQYAERLESELEMIHSMGFTAYHLIVAEFTNWAKDQGIAVGPGRGSAAGSVVCWSMRITDVNSLQFGLMFERYLNPERISMPDIDMDFSQKQRDEVLGHVREKYGEECVGQILTVGRMKAKAALKDCARACAVHFLDADGWTKQMDDGPGVKLRSAIMETPSLRALWDGDPRFRRIASVAMAVEQNPRQTGVHAAGVIITSQPIHELIPMHVEDGKRLTGVRDKYAETLGLVKFDFLGLKTLDIVEEARSSVERRTGVLPNPVQPLFDDPEVYQLLSAGDALGLFQVESHGMQDLLRRMKPDHIEDIIAICALYRPGPLGSGMVDDYVECKHERQEIRYPHPLLEGCLKRTYGVMVYQEQVMEAAQVLAGYTLGGADMLRRAMGKKIQAEMDAQKATFVAGCKTQGIDEDDAVRIFKLIDHFAGYGFNKTISEDTWVLRAGSNASMTTPWIQIKDLVRMWGARKNGRLTPMAKKLRSGRLRLIQMDSDGRCRPGRLVTIHDHGVKPVYQLRTAGGHVSPPMSWNHRIMTTNGYRALNRGGIKLGTQIVVMGEMEENAYVGWWSSDDSRFAQRYRINESYLALTHDVWKRDKGHCRHCGIPGERRRGGHEVAHIQTPAQCDYDHQVYHSLANLVLLCNGCHKKIDYEKGERTKRWGKGRPTFLDTVVAIELVGEHQCYDLEMDTEGHNYVAASSPGYTGIISHNSHSASYGIITYMTAYMKTHHRADFMAAAMSFEQSNREKLVAYVSDCSRADIPVLLPDINRSSLRFHVEPSPFDTSRFAIRYGLEAIKGIGGAALQSILQAREGQPFTSIADIQARTSANKTVMTALVCSGALDSLEPDRFEAWWSIKRPQPKKIKKNVAENQLLLFGGGQTVGEVRAEKQAEEEAEIKPSRWRHGERLEHEAAATGCWLSGHPLDRYLGVEEMARTCTTPDLETKKKKDPVTLVGVITKIHKIRTRRGHDMTFFSLADRLGILEVVVPPPVYTRYKPLIQKGSCVQVHGKLDRDGAEGKLIVERVDDLAILRGNMARSLELVLYRAEATDTFLRRLKTTLDRFLVGKARRGCPLFISIQDPEHGFTERLSLDGDPTFEPHTDLFHEIETITERPTALRLHGSRPI